MESWKEVGFLGFCDGIGVWREFMGGDAVKSCHGKWLRFLETNENFNFQIKFEYTSYLGPNF